MKVPRGGVPQVSIHKHLARGGTPNLPIVLLGFSARVSHQFDPGIGHRTAIAEVRIKVTCLAELIGEDALDSHRKGLPETQQPTGKESLVQAISACADRSSRHRHLQNIDIGVTEKPIQRCSTG